MRTLMLHGHGTSAYIFKSQTVAFRSKLDERFSFDFVDGPFPSSPSPGVELFFKAPKAEAGNFTWFLKPEIDDIRASHKWLLDYIDKNGPYDNVCCFSQGCSLIASLLLYSRGGRPFPFKSAVFICGGINFSVLEDVGFPVSEKAKEINAATGKLLMAKTSLLARLASNLDDIQRGYGLWDDTTALLHDPAVLPARSDCFGLDFTAFPDEDLIGIPTAHIYGAKDPRWVSSVQLAYLCRDKIMYDHQGGHDIPRSSEASQMIATIFRNLAATLVDTSKVVT